MSFLVSPGWFLDHSFICSFFYSTTHSSFLHGTVPALSWGQPLHCTQGHVPLYLLRADTPASLPSAFCILGSSPSLIIPINTQMCCNLSLLQSHYHPPWIPQPNPATKPFLCSLWKTMLQKSCLYSGSPMLHSLGPASVRLSSLPLHQMCSCKVASDHHILGPMPVLICLLSDLSQHLTQMGHSSPPSKVFFAWLV